MGSSIQLGRIWGIPIGLHISWFLIFGLVTWSLAAGYFPSSYPGLSTGAYWLLGALTSLLFFGSVLMHELGHAYLALRNQIPVRGITLFIFGGVAQIGRDPGSPGAEFRIAIAGPIVSLALAAIFGGLWLLDQQIPYLAAPSMWLARINAILAIFNMIPGFPLDGGRVFRAIVWKFTGDFRRATQIATTLGQFIAFAFIALGLFTVLRGNFFNGIWLVFIGWFLQNAAAASFQQLNLRELLRGVRVEQVMAPGCPVVSGRTALTDIVEDHILPAGQRCFLVAENGHPRGLLTFRDVTKVPRGDWNNVQVAEVMVPWNRLVQVNPKSELLEVLDLMDESDVAQLPVVEGNQLVGMLSRDQVLHYIRLRGEIGV
jgi:Zn-dependent protease/CBS domain-containing protein